LDQHSDGRGLAIHLDRLRQGEDRLDGSGGLAPFRDSRGAAGRALSHVALHEIYHVLSGRKHHDAEGLFKAEYSPADLLAPVTLRPTAVAEIAGLSEPAIKREFVLARQSYLPADRSTSSMRTCARPLAQNRERRARSVPGAVGAPNDFSLHSRSLRKHSGKESRTVRERLHLH